MTENFLLALNLITLGACTGEKIPQSLATAYQSKYFIEEEALERKIAFVIL